MRAVIGCFFHFNVWSEARLRPARENKTLKLSGIFIECILLLSDMGPSGFIFGFPPFRSFVCASFRHPSMRRRQVRAGNSWRGSAKSPVKSGKIYIFCKRGTKISLFLHFLIENTSKNRVQSKNTNLRRSHHLVSSPSTNQQSCINTKKLWPINDTVIAILSRVVPKSEQPNVKQC